MKIMFHFFSPFLKIKKKTAENIYTVLDSYTKCLQIFFEINEKRRVCATEKRTNSLCKVDYLSSNPVHTAISSIGIYQNCTIKNGHKKAQKPLRLWFFGLASKLDA